MTAAILELIDGAKEVVLDQLPAFGSVDRVKLAVYAGGHMFYNRDASRKALREDAAAMFRDAMRPVTAGE